MSSADRISSRLVVQRIWKNSLCQSSYRLIVYSNDRTYQPLQFDTVDEVLKALRVVLPEIDANLFYQEVGETPSIIFATEVKLIKEQLSILGLKE